MTGKRYHVWQRAIAELGGLSYGERLLYVQYLDMASEDLRLAWPSAATLARKLHTTKAAARHLRNTLVDKKYLIPTGGVKARSRIFQVADPTTPKGSTLNPPEGSILNPPEGSIPDPQGVHPEPQPS